MWWAWSGPRQLTVPVKFQVVVVLGGNSKPGWGEVVTVTAQVLPSPAGAVVTVVV